MARCSFQHLLSFVLLARAVQAGIYSGQFSTPRAHNVSTVARRAGNGLINMGYFPNWAPDANFKADDIPIKTLTHIMYAFADTDKDTGAMKLSDPGNDAGSAEDGTLGGQLGALFKLKQKQRNLKVLISVGGGSFSSAGHFDFVVNADARAKFVDDAIRFIEDYGLDGIDIDYEALTDDQEDSYVALIKALREALDKYAADKGDKTPYLLTSAVGWKPGAYVAEAGQYMDYYGLMNYDYSGSWVETTEHQANLYPSGSNNNRSTDGGLAKWLEVVPKEKLILGQPLYARCFVGTDGIGKPYTDVGGPDGTRAYKDLPSAGDGVTEDTEIGASYTYDPNTRELCSYDTPAVTKVKAKYIQDKGLAGAMFWDLSNDKTGDESLVGITADLFGELDQTLNHLNFPGSAFDNVRGAGADEQTPGGGGEAPAPSPVPSAEPTPEPSAVPTPEPSAEPSPEPSAEPSPEPSEEPSPEPSPTVGPAPSKSCETKRRPV